MSRIPLGLWKPRPGESRKEFAARVTREMKAIARQKRLTNPNPEQDEKERDRILKTQIERTEQFEDGDG